MKIDIKYLNQVMINGIYQIIVDEFSNVITIMQKPYRYSVVTLIEKNKKKKSNKVFDKII